MMCSLFWCRLLGAPVVCLRDGRELGRRRLIMPSHGSWSFCRVFLLAYFLQRVSGIPWRFCGVLLYEDTYGCGVVVEDSRAG